MNSSRIAEEIERMASQEGIVGCALVEAATGLVWYSSGGSPESERLWEAAVDYWRLHERLKANFASLGKLSATVMYHSEGVLAAFPCCTNPDMLLVAHGRHRGVDWKSWQRMVKALGNVVVPPQKAALASPTPTRSGT